MLRILLADADCVLVAIIRAFLEHEGFRVVAEALDGPEALQSARRHRPDVAILSRDLPRRNGLDSARDILQHDPTAVVILLDIAVDAADVVAAVRDGVRGYVFKTDIATELPAAIRRVVDGGAYLSTTVRRNVGRRIRLPHARTTRGARDTRHTAGLSSDRAEAADE